MIEFSPSFAELLLKYRRRLDLSQQEVAVVGEIHPSDLSKMERGVKQPPRVEVILRLVDGLKLSRKEAREFIEAAGYSTSVLERVKFDPSKYPLVKGVIEERLKGSHGFWPVWELDVDGTIVAANLLAFRLLRALEETDDIIEPNRLLGENIFKICIREENFSRISMPEKQEDFWYTTIAVWNKLKDTVQKSVVVAFEKAIEAHPILGLLLRYGTVDVEREWEYYLNIYPSVASPSLDEPKVYLEFLVQVERIVIKGQHTGYLVTCQPLKPFTIGRTEREYSRLITTFGKDAFVQRSRNTQVLEETLKFPSFYPAIHHDAVWNINFENTVFKRLFEEYGEFEGKHYFDMLLSSRVLALMEGIDRRKLLIPMRQFLQRTKFFEHEESPYHEQYLQVKAHLLHHPVFQSLLTELWQTIPTSEALPRPEEGMACFSIELACPFTDVFKLSFNVIARLPYESEVDYRVTFSPTTVATRIALILLRLRDGATINLIGTNECEQLLWLLAILKTIQEGLTKRKGDAWWHSETAFKQIHSGLITTLNVLEDIKFQTTWTLMQVLLNDESRQEGILAMLNKFVEPIPDAHAFLPKSLQQIGEKAAPKI